MGKKDTEEECLRWAVESAKQHKGTSKRILKYLACEELPREKAERPDFVKIVRTEGKGKKDILLGIEHFRVDHYSIEKRDGKIASTGASQETSIQHVWEKWHGVSNDEEYLPGIAKDLESFIIKEHVNREMASYPNLIKSYDYAFSKHLKNVGDYRKNLKELSGGDYQTQLAFLIEIRTSFHDLFFHNKHGIRQQKHGIGPIFDDYIRFIEDNVNAKEVDYIIFCITGTLKTKDTMVVAVETSQIREKLLKVHIPIYQYIGTDFFLQPFNGLERNVNVTSELEHAEDHFVYHLSGTQDSLDDRTRLDLRMYCLYCMVELKRRGTPFVTDGFVQIFYDAMADHIIGWKKPEDARDDWVIHPVLRPYLPGEVNERLKQFGEQWGYNKG